MTVSTEILNSAGAYPWDDTVSQNLGFAACGSVSYRIEPQATAQDLLLTYYGDTLTWSPDLSILPGTYTFKLIGKLDRYGFESSVDFFVKVLPCTTSLSIQSIYLGDMSRLWSQKPVIQEFGNQLSPVNIIQSPNCMYDYTLSAHLVFESSPNLIDWNSPLPAELDFSSSNAGFALSKCHAYGDQSLTDEECNSGVVPYAINRRIALVVTLEDSTFDAVFFNTRIEGCGYDAIALSGEISSYEYFIYATPQTWTYDLIVGQTYDLCPLSCSVSPATPYYIGFG